MENTERGACDRAIRGSDSSVAIAEARRLTETSPLLPLTPMTPLLHVNGLGSIGRAALAVAAGVATVCGASMVAAGSPVSCEDGGASSSVISVSIPPPPASAAVVLTAQQQALVDLYCQGPLLDTVQLAGLFNDSKYFVDMPVKNTSTPAQILAEFNATIQPALRAHPENVNQTLLDFLNAHFDEPGSEIQTTVPPDFTASPEPPRIAAIQDAGYKSWALALHALWKELGRAPSRQAVSSYLQPTPLASLGDSSTSTLIVVPGGRFRESYYWDSYWIVEGLVVSNMRTTARRVVQNLLEYVGEFGFVPNGGRIYYLTRSQPPMLSDMVRLVATKETTSSSSQLSADWDLDYLRAVVPLLEKEYSYWMATHRVDVTVGGVTFALNRYTGEAGEPRPESYREDVLLANASFPGDATRETAFYNDMIAAAESGWDFSSRWFRDQKTLATVDTKNVLPVDLNSIMYRVESNIATFYAALGYSSASARFSDAAAARARALDAVFWDDASSSWRDFVLDTKTRSPVVSVANYYPLWADAFHTATTGAGKNDRLTRIVQSLRKSGLIQVAGVQTTTQETGQQWDAPNAWPPLQDILIEGLLHVNTTESQSLAKELVGTWIKTSFAAWNQTGLMFEKYNATIVGGLGAGGEYTPQFGFGWSNGVVLKFLTEYQDFL